MERLMIHMTTTGRQGRITWGVVCRCGWRADALSQAEARAAGDAHLAEANAPEVAS
jgi:hypothetical protein